MQSSYSSYPSFFQARRGASTKKRNQRGSSPLLQRPTPDRRLGIQSPYRRRYLIPADGRNTTFGGRESAQVAEKADPCPMEARCPASGVGDGQVRTPSSDSPRQGAAVPRGYGLMRVGA